MPKKTRGKIALLIYQTEQDVPAISLHVDEEKELARMVLDLIFDGCYRLEIVKNATESAVFHERRIVTVS